MGGLCKLVDPGLKAPPPVSNFDAEKRHNIAFNFNLIFLSLRHYIEAYMLVGREMHRARAYRAHGRAHRNRLL